MAGLLLPVAGAHGRYRFSHDLVRETLYGELSPKRRARLHLRVAEVIEALFPTSIDAHLAELAFHYVKALEGGGTATDAGDPVGPRAIDYARRAGDQAARSLAYEEADRLYRMALAGLDLTGATDERSRTAILLALGEVQARAGDFEGARVTFLRAADAARRTGAGEQLAQAALGYGGRLPWARPGRDTRADPAPAGRAGDAGRRRPAPAGLSSRATRLRVAELPGATRRQRGPQPRGSADRPGAWTTWRH